MKGTRNPPAGGHKTKRSIGDLLRKKSGDPVKDPDSGTPVARMFGTDPDPRSSNYRRILIRPTISWGRILLPGLLPLAAAALWLWGAARLGVPGLWHWVTAAGMLVLWFCLRGKAMVVALVRIYQRYAPERLRMKCRYEPSCSQYMIRALERYGLFRGLWKGIDRLRRCNRSGGGIDPP